MKLCLHLGAVTIVRVSRSLHTSAHRTLEKSSESRIASLIISFQVCGNTNELGSCGFLAVSIHNISEFGGKQDICWFVCFFS